MINYLYSIRDERSAFGPLFQARSDAEAERQFQMLLKDESSIVHLFSDDFALYAMGFFNDESGDIIVNSGNPILLVRGRDFE